jgi:hypothetical protein
MTKTFTLSSIHRTAAQRPEGYVQDVLSHGTVNGDKVTLSDDAYSLLVVKYRGPEAAAIAKPRAPSLPPPSVPSSSGPGTELKSLLKDWLGIVASPNCSCNARARQMDEWGPDLCEQNLPTIVDWLGEQAAARKLPFVRFAGEQAVKLAIRRARKKAAR